MSKRNIYFYKLGITHKILENGRTLTKKLEKEEVYVFFKKLYIDLPSNTDGCKYIKHNLVDNQYYLIEFIEFTKDFAFIRLGKPSQNNEVGKRNVESYSLIDIPLENAELIEAYTYLYIDFKTDVVSFVRIGSAPGVNWFEAPITALNTGTGYKVNCTPFSTDEILESYGSNVEIGSISISTVKPTLEILKYINGITEEDIENLESSELNVVLSIKPKKRGGNTIVGINNIKKLFRKTKESDSNMKKFAVNIADELDEKKNMVDLMNYRFTRSSDILSTDNLTPQQYKEEIVKVYEKELPTLKRLFNL